MVASSLILILPTSVRFLSMKKSPPQIPVILSVSPWRRERRFEPASPNERSESQDSSWIAWCVAGRPQGRPVRRSITYIGVRQVVRHPGSRSTRDEIPPGDRWRFGIEKWVRTSAVQGVTSAGAVRPYA